MTKREVDVCIIGGGLMGCFAAFFLSEAGRSTIVLEKGRVGREASGTNFGNLRLQGRKPVEFPLSLLAHDLWERFDELTGESCSYDGSGHAYIAFGNEHHDRLDQYAAEAAAAGLDVSVLDAGEVHRRWPQLSAVVSAATWSPRDGVADPVLACPAVARAARRKGAVIEENTRALSINGDAGTFVVATDTGDEIACAHVVNAAGAWANQFAVAMGEAVPMFAAGPPIIETMPVAPLGIPSMLAVDGSIIFRQVVGGEVIIASFPRQPSDLVTGAPAIPPERIARDLDRLAQVVPALRGVEAKRAWSGVEGYLPDMLPVLGPSRTTPGLIHAFGYCGHGYQLAPGVGRVIADLILRGRTAIPIEAFSIDRFAHQIAADYRLSREFEPSAITRK